VPAFFQMYFFFFSPSRRWDKAFFPFPSMQDKQTVSAFPFLSRPFPPSLFLRLVEGKFLLLPLFYWKGNSRTVCRPLFSQPLFSSFFLLEEEAKTAPPSPLRSFRQKERRSVFTFLPPSLSDSFFFLFFFFFRAAKGRRIGSLSPSSLPLQK